MITTILQYVLTGMAIGAIYALVALGFHIMWTTAGAVNFAHGNTLMGSAIVTIFLMDYGVPLSIAIILALLAAALFGILLEKVAVRPFTKRGADPLGWVLTTIAVGMMIEALVTMETDGFARALPLPMMDNTVSIFGANVYLIELIIPSAAILIAIGLSILNHKTLFGRSMVAVSFSHQGASIMGINVNFVVAMSFALAAIIGGIAGVLIAPVTQVSATMGLALGLKGFVVAIVGGITSAFGGLVIGFGLGILEKLVEGFISTSAREIIGFACAIILLLIFPQGVFGQKRIYKI